MICRVDKISQQILLKASILFFWCSFLKPPPDPNGAVGILRSSHLFQGNKVGDKNQKKLITQSNFIYPQEGVCINCLSRAIWLWYSTSSLFRKHSYVSFPVSSSIVCTIENHQASQPHRCLRGRKGQHNGGHRMFRKGLCRFNRSRGRGTATSVSATKREVHSFNALQKLGSFVWVH